MSGAVADKGIRYFSWLPWNKDKMVSGDYATQKPAAREEKRKLSEEDKRRLQFFAELMTSGGAPVFIAWLDGEIEKLKNSPRSEGIPLDQIVKHNSAVEGALAFAEKVKKELLTAGKRLNEEA